MKDEILLSVVIPAYNEAKGIEAFHSHLLMPQFEKLADGSYEIIYIDDGSSDETLAILTSLARDNPAIKIISFSKNFGKEIATTAGIFNAKGKAIMMLDADGQHPPELISAFVEKWRDGAQVVVGVRSSNQKEGPLKKWGSKLFYKLFNSASGSQIEPRSTDFRLIDRAVQQEFIRCQERGRMTRGLIDWLGFDRAYVEFDAPARLAGKASYSTKQLFQLAISSFVSLSIKPLEALAWFGLFITVISFITGLFIAVEQLFLQDPLALNITGSAMLGVFITFLVGLLMTSQGIVAIYMSHIYIQTQGRPLFIINKKTSVNLDED